MKLVIGQLMFELTRRCNLQCAHCVRGEAEAVDLSVQDMKHVLTQCQSITEIAFTGGEPTLAQPMIQKALDICKDYGVPVHRFFMATNGQHVDERLIQTLVEWYAYILSCNGGYEEEGMMSVKVSEDQYHPKLSMLNKGLLKALRFVSFENDEHGGGHRQPDTLIAEGRAQGLHGTYRRPAPDEYEFYRWRPGEDCLEIAAGLVYVNAKGRLIRGCDWSFESQDDPESGLDIGHCSDIVGIFTKMSDLS